MGWFLPAFSQGSIRFYQTDLELIDIESMQKVWIGTKEIKKEISISFENRRTFASVLIRNRSIKLVLRIQHRLASPRILSINRIDAKSFDHTIVLDSKNDIDNELMSWLQDAYHSSE